jgi:hypothetical protein
LMGLFDRCRSEGATLIVPVLVMIGWLASGRAFMAQLGIAQGAWLSK